MMASLEQASMAIVIVLLGAAIGIVAWLGAALVNRMLAKQPGAAFATMVYRRVAGGLRLFLPCLGALLASYAAADDWLVLFRRVDGIVLVAIGAYLLIRILYGIEDFVEDRLGLDQADNLDARRTITQLRLLRRVLVFFVVLLAIIVVLLSFDGAREIGAGLLASAGIAGLVIGFAAQRTLGNLLAGFQIAVTQPIRLDDVVVVEGEWGRIEEITLTYVVVRIWDERRLILPISYFLEQPFTNWTRESSAILGTVFLYTDYTVPVDALRDELDRVVTASPHWDGRVKGLVVTDSKPDSLELRALVSARDGAAAWDLRCEVREALVGFLQREYPGALPRFRAELTQDPATPREPG